MSQKDRFISGVRITVGHQDADIITTDNRGLQAAVDYVAGLGGGLVDIGPGEYLMKDSLHLRSGVTIRGQGNETILRKCDGCFSKLVLDGDHGEEQVTLADPLGFEVGMGISVIDDRSRGFHISVATIVGAEGNIFRLSRPLVGDYIITENARASNAVAVISGYYVDNIRIENILVEGNKTRNHPITGCLGAGIYLYRGCNVHIQNCRVENYTGDGISYQKSDDVVIVDCVVRGNTALGIHPGSGSLRTVVRGCEVADNGRDGIFICWRVQQGVFEHNRVENNGSAGISIGHKDTDNLIRGNIISNNGRYGILFREELPVMGAHRNRIEQNIIKDNGTLENEGYGIMIESDVLDVEIVDNTISGQEVQRFSIYSKSAEEVVLLENKVDPTTVQLGSFRRSLPQV